MVTTSAYKGLPAIPQQSQRQVRNVYFLATLTLIGEEYWPVFPPKESQIYVVRRKGGNYTYHTNSDLQAIVNQERCDLLYAGYALLVNGKMQFYMDHESDKEKQGEFQRFVAACDHARHLLDSAFQPSTPPEMPSEQPIKQFSVGELRTFFISILIVIALSNVLQLLITAFKN